MKLTTLCFLVSLFGLHASNSYSQKTVTIKLKDVEVSELLDLIENQTEYHFVYKVKDVNLTRKIQVNAQDEKVSGVLDKIFKGTDTKYEFYEDQIFLTRKPAKLSSSTTPINLQETITVTGTVTEAETGMPVPAANILEKGTSNGVMSDFDGNYSIEVPDDAILQVSYIGYATQEVEVNNRNEVDVVLEQDAAALDEVVVTALGIRREKKALGYSVQEVEGEELQTAKEPNVLSSLTGKVAGLTIKNSPGLFQNPQLTLRGNGNVLVVIDGVPRDTNFWDVNSDDIDEMTVLKGPAAAALYGSRGKNGAIMITTKRGGDGSGMEISTNSSFMFQPGFVFKPKRQAAFGQGDWGEFSYVDGAGGGLNDSDVYSWGPRLNQKDPNTDSGWLELPQWNSPIDETTGERVPIPFISRGKNNIENFFRTGNVISNNISIGSTNDRGDIRFSATQLDQKGKDPNARLDATTVSLSGSQRFSELFKMEASVTYNKQYSENYPTTSYYADNNMYNIMVWMSPDVDVRDLKQYWIPGKEGVKQRNYNYAYYNNPYYIANEYLQEYKKDVVYGYAKLLFDLTPDLKLSLRSSINWFNRYQAQKRPKGFVGYAPGYANGGFYPNNYYEFDMNNEFLFTYDKTLFEDWTINAVFGGNNRNFNSRALSTSSSALSVPDVYNLGNSSEPLTGSNYNLERRVNSLYGSVNVGYDDMLYLSVTGRNDWSSAMPAKHNSYFYPSISLSAILNEMIDLPEFIPFAKIRGSWIKVGSDMSPYSIKPAYNYGTTWDKTPSIYMSNNLPSLDIEPDFKTTYELGADIRFFSNRLGIDATYYNDLETNMITNSQVSIASGYSSRKINSSRKTKREGWEVAISATPLRTKDWNWNIGLNWSTNSQYLVRAEEGKERRDGYTKEGEKYGYLWYKNEFDHSADGRVIYRDGLPVITSDAQNFGYARSRWEAGLNNSIKYKNITFSFSIDGRWGGLIYSRLNQKLWESGLHAESANAETSAYRDADNQDQKAYVGDGLIVTGGEIERDVHGAVINDTRTYKENDVPVYYRDWVNRNYNQGRWTTSTFDGTFFKLREVIIGYKLPSSLTEKVYVKGAKISLIGRNLLLWTKEEGNIDPDVDASQGETRLYVPTPRNIGFNLKLNF